MSRAIDAARTRLAQWRIDRGETQKSVGACVGWDQATYSKFENGVQDATVDQLDLLAAHYGKSLADLFVDLAPASPDPELVEWINFYWRLSEKGRMAQLETWRLTVPKKTRPAGAARRSVKRALAQGGVKTPARPRNADDTRG